MLLAVKDVSLGTCLSPAIVKPVALVKPTTTEASSPGQPWPRKRQAAWPIIVGILRRALKLQYRLEETAIHQGGVLNVGWFGGSGVHSLVYPLS